MTGNDRDTNRFTVHNVFSRQTHDTLRVTVIGPWPSKGWGYEVRCRVPRLSDEDACAAGADDDACPSAACARATFDAAAPTVCCATGGTKIDMGLAEEWPLSVSADRESTGGDNSENSTSLVIPEEWSEHCDGHTKRQCEKDPVCRHVHLSSALSDACEPAIDLITASSSTWKAYCGDKSKSQCRVDNLCGYYSDVSRVCHPANWHNFCTGQPDGAFCGEYDSLCSSNACVGGRCVGSKVGIVEEV